MKYFLLIFFFFSFCFILPGNIYAFDTYVAEDTGFDISYPQCPHYFPDDAYAFGIIGVNGGKAFTQNECLQEEYFWAKKAKTEVSLYMNLNYPSGDTEELGLFGPKGTCLENNTTCQAYNYGYNAAKDAYQYALSKFASSKIWWIDVETANTWADTFVLNNQVLQGAIDYFNSENVQAGVYSTKREWTMVMGSDFIPMQQFIQPLPNWIGTGLDEIDPYKCLQPFIPHSPVWMIQYAHQGFDGNYVCI